MASNLNLNWLLDDLVARVPEVEKAVVLSRDGLAIGSSGGLAQEEAERLAAIAAGFHSLARGATADLEAGPVRQVIVEMADAYLLISMAGDNGCLAVVTTETANLGLVAYETALLVNRVRAQLPTFRPVAPGGGAT